MAGIANAFTLQPGDSNYETITPAQGSQTGFGYWAYFPSPGSKSLAAGSGAPYVVSAPAGQFIMIGDPSGSAPASVTGADTIYAYDPTAGYQSMTTLLPGRGAWAMSAGGGKITITPSAPAAPSISQPAPAAGAASLPGFQPIVGAGYQFQAPSD